MPRHRFTAEIRRTSTIARGTERRVDLRIGRDTVPAIWLAPARVSTPCPTALLLHGFSSSKERMAQAIGRALLARGVGSRKSVV